MANDPGFQDITQLKQLLQNLLKLVNDGTTQLAQQTTATVKKNIASLFAEAREVQEEGIEGLKATTAALEAIENDFLAKRKAGQLAMTEAELEALGKVREAELTTTDDRYDYQLKQFKKVELEKRKQFTKTLKEQTEDNAIQYRAQLEAKRQAEVELLEGKKRQLELSGQAETAQYKKVQKELDKLKKNENKRKRTDAKTAEKRAKADAIKSAKERAEAIRKVVADKSLTKDERLQQLEDMGMSPDEAKQAYSEASSKNLQNKLVKSVINGVHGIRNVARSLNEDIEASARLRGSVDTRLQGSRLTQKEGSYWAEMNSNIVGASAISPIVSQRQLVDNTKQLIDSGIAFNVEQRAALMTLSDRIASTFNAADGTLLRLIRIQQADTTAARLGMESALTAFLNNMYETTEYMGTIARTIQENITSATALMGATEAVEFEYQVQKWMGSMYSTGMSQGAVQGLAGALGQLASGDTAALTQGGYGNLIMMAANRAGIPITDALHGNLGADGVNALLGSVVDYMSELYDSSGGNNLLATEYGKVFGISAADLKAAKNLDISTGDIYANNLSYGGMMARLTEMANSIYKRTSAGELVSNVKNNMMYSMATSIASDPSLYATYAIADALDQYASGGMKIPDITAMVAGTGVGVSLDLTIADVMKMGALGGGLMNSVGSVISGISKGGDGGTSGTGILKALGLDTSSTVISEVSRGGDKRTLALGGFETGTSSSGHIGNEESGIVESQAMYSAKQQQEAAKVEAQQSMDEATDTTLKDVNTSVLDIYTLLSNLVADGSQALKVLVTNPD